MSVDLESLTGIRSGKRSYYKEFVRSDERLHSTLRSMESISQAVVRTVEGPRGLLDEVTRAAQQHLDADWAMLVIADHEFPGARPRCIVVTRQQEATIDEEEFPPGAARELMAIRGGAVPGNRARCVRAPMRLEDRVVGMLSVRHRLASDPEGADLAVLQILANQAAVSLHTSEQFQSGLALHRQAQRLNAETEVQRRDLSERTAALRAAERQLLVAEQRELVEAERHRIARELHDTVTQQVLSVGMSLEIARGEAADLGADGDDLQQQLVSARDLAGRAVEQLRQAIYSLYQPNSDRVRSLEELLDSLVTQYRSGLAVRLRVSGAQVELPEPARHELTRAAGEALFNAAMHSHGTRATVHLRRRPDELILTIDDDGDGDPADLRRRLKVTATAPCDGRHRGLINMAERITRLGGTMSVRRARIGGVSVRFHLPLPAMTVNDLTDPDPTDVALAHTTLTDTIDVPKDS
ncbi:GAF domain-containing sensor histidine kinase [Rudaeicoccus suwonensis]|uniref:GAF domain-containing protein n=1 Tax=Rudaeicoccus suwonensis TaxID=657409 RepID=A0A561E8J2_9MICO|nr:histidine kinase [Rudaeicoccus suwonensis]TWE11938.1 GAF domain-containing protein [Rudaeicoccus suwonensis]